MAHSIVALRERAVMETDLRRLVDSLPGLIWTVGLDRQGHLLNHTWHERAGISADAARGDGWQATIHSDGRLEVTGIWHSLLGSADARPRVPNPCPPVHESRKHWHQARAHIGLLWRDRTPEPRRLHSGHDRAQVAVGTGARSPRDSGALHHAAPRDCAASMPQRAYRRPSVKTRHAKPSQAHFARSEELL
jgi:PAS domain-containing protein